MKQIKEKRPMFSVIVPTYNQSDYLGSALESLVVQTEPDWEAVVVNDGSTDSTPAVIEKYAKKDKRIKTFHKANGGVASALNYGLRRAGGAWICWLSSDDLFEKKKFEIHRNWIEREPDTAFFHTYFFLLRESSGTIESTSHWHSIPEREWQVLEMLRGTYISGISICIRRDAVESVGGFNERLSYAQDYDFWLRLLPGYPATFIPERTCIQRVHLNQTTNTFPEALFFDSARAAINLLNGARFEQLVPLVDLNDREKARQAVAKAIDVAGTFTSLFLYGLGPHQALLWRIIEWALAYEKRTNDSSITKYLADSMEDVCSKKHQDSAARAQWKSAFTALRLEEGDFEYVPVSPDETARKRYWQLCAEGNGGANCVKRYLKNFGEEVALPDERIKKGPARNPEVVLVCRKGDSIDKLVKSETDWSIRELARHLMMAGKQVLLLGLSDKRLGMRDGIIFIGAASDKALFDALSFLSSGGAVVGVSRADIFSRISPKKALMYQRDASLPAGEGFAKIIKSKNVHVAVISDRLKDLMRANGVPCDNLYVVYDGYDDGIFKYRNDKPRARRRIVFVGMDARYKGIDTVLRAFELLKENFPEAELHVYGSKGYPVWEREEKELDGVKYMEEAGQEILAAAFQEASLLIVPRRVDETSGNILLAAQACGCIPVLAGRGGFSETIQNGLTGYIADENTPESISRFIAGLWNSGKPLEEQRLQASLRAGNNYTKREMCRQMAELLDRYTFWRMIITLLDNIYLKILKCAKNKAGVIYRGLPPIIQRFIKTISGFMRV